MNEQAHSSIAKPDNQIRVKCTAIDLHDSTYLSVGQWIIIDILAIGILVKSTKKLNYLVNVSAWNEETTVCRKVGLQRVMLFMNSQCFIVKVILP